MLKYTYFFTILVLLVTTSLRQTAQSSSLAIVQWIYITLASLLLFICNPRKSKFQILFLTCFCIYFIFHLAFTNDRLITALMLVTSVLFLINIDNKKFISKNIFYLIISYSLLNIIIFFPNFYKALRSLNIDHAFLGFTLNTNTNSTIGCLFFISGIYINSLKSSLVSKAVIGLSILYLLACMSRNSMLFPVVFIILLLIAKITKKINFWGPLIILLFILSSFFFLTEKDDSSLSFFGKEGSSFRSSMIIYSIKNFEITWFGVGKDYLSGLIKYEFNYALHNGYLISIYSFGITYLMLYLAYIIYFYRKLRTNTSRCLILAIHSYYFFEPLIFLNFTQLHL